MTQSLSYRFFLTIGVVGFMLLACNSSHSQLPRVECENAIQRVEFYTGHGLERYEARLASFYELPSNSGGISFLGDSITERFGDGFFGPEIQYFNLGVGGDETSGLINRFSIVERLSPKQIFVLIGTNDISRGRDMLGIKSNLNDIVNLALDVVVPEKLLLVSVLPRGDHNNLKVAELNTYLVDLASQSGAIYVDAHKKLVDQSEERIRPEFSSDGIHLTPQGYDVLKGEILKFLSHDISLSTSEVRGEYIGDWFPPNCAINNMSETQKS